LKRYEEFYKNYDAEKDFERMRRAGVFRSAPAGDEVVTEVKAVPAKKAGDETEAKAAGGKKK